MSKENKGLFNLEFLENGDYDDDMLNIDLNESADKDDEEDKDKKKNKSCGSKNESGNDEELHESTNTDMGAKKNYDEVSIPVPGTKEISAKVYNTAVERLQKSFNEAFDELKQYTVVEATADEIQEELTEAAVSQAIFESYANGPFFEAVNRKDKAEIKSIALKMQDRVDTNTDKYMLIPSKWLGKIFKRGAAVNTKAWQSVGVFYAHQNEFDDAVKYYNKKFKDELGDYILNVDRLKVRSSISWANIGDFLAIFAGFVSEYKSGPLTAIKAAKLKKSGSPFLLIVDSKRKDPEDIEIKPINPPKESDSNKKDDDKKNKDE